MTGRRIVTSGLAPLSSTSAVPSPPLAKQLGIFGGAHLPDRDLISLQRLEYSDGGVLEKSCDFSCGPVAMWVLLAPFWILS